ncbi:MAG: TauD/TfdA family dioxygenase [Gammaproteobacteria bacterium]|jgi:taurine dioxygenase|nr:TauD/TfdA family dioxygenase [Luminiphilus sp.]NCG07809.1 TauD/TfdA family dioxygenase [Gammaproteobacteria bacterium]
MTLTVTPSGQACGARIEGIDLTQDLSNHQIAELRQLWLEHKVIAFPNQALSPEDLERVAQYFGDIGEDPFFGHIDGYPNICAIQRDADEKTSIFAEIFHTDWSFMDIPPAGTALFGITIPPHGGDTLFADQVKAHEEMPDDLRAKVEGLTAIHSAAFGYAPDGAYGSSDQESGRSMQIKPSEKARETCAHPLVREHHETGTKALFSSAAYIQRFEDMSAEDSQALLMELYVHQTQEKFQYRHRWEKDMLVIWDNRSLLHSATGGFDGYDRLLHRVTIADTRW